MCLCCLVILVLSSLPSLCHLFPSLVSPYLIPLCLLSCVGSLSNIVSCDLWVFSLNLVIWIVVCVSVCFLFLVIKFESSPSLLYCISLGIMPFSSVLPPCGFCFLCFVFNKLCVEYSVCFWVCLSAYSWHICYNFDDYGLQTF